jgi:hypothetical protein
MRALIRDLLFDPLSEQPSASVANAVAGASMPMARARPIRTSRVHRGNAASSAYGAPRSRPRQYATAATGAEATTWPAASRATSVRGCMKSSVLSAGSVYA